MESETKRLGSISQTQRTAKFIRRFLLSLVIGIWCLGFNSFASAKEYDGIWFLGFNLQKAPFNNVRVRQAVAHCLNKDFIASSIMSEEITPASIIPPGMLGYDPELKPYKTNVSFAKSLMKKAKFPPITLLHTDGVKTVEIAERIQQELRRLGMKIRLVQVSYRDQEKWNQELSSKKYSLFLMGFKASHEKLLTDEAAAGIPDTAKLLEPLFIHAGEANFTGYSNPKVSLLFDQLSVISPALASERETRLNEINRILYRELPVIVLFYIEKL